MILLIGIQEQELNMNKQINKSKMRRLVLVLVVLATTLSCQKEEIKPQTQDPLGTQQEQVLEMKINK
jgi:hypothetical protein